MKTYTFHVSTPDLPNSWRRVEVAAEQTLAHLHMAIQEALDWDPDDDISFYVGENPLEGGVEYILDIDEDWDEEDDDELESMIEDLPPLEIDDALRPQTMEDALALLESNPEVRAHVRQMLVDQMGVPGFMADLMLSNLRSLRDMLPEGALTDLGGGASEVKDAASTSLEALGLTVGQALVYMVGDDDWRFDVRVEAINDSAEDDAFYPVVLDGEGPAPEQYFGEEYEEDEPFAWLGEDLEEDDDLEDEA